MLEMTAAPRQPTSRLSCQIVLDASLDGLSVGCPTPSTESCAAPKPDTRRRELTPAARQQEARLATARIARQALRHPRRRAAHRRDADDLRQPDRPQPDRHDASSATSSSRAPPPAPRSRSSCRGARCSAATSSSTSSPPRPRRARPSGSTASARCCSAWRWRCSPGAPTLGGVNAWKSGSGTMLIGFPEWIDLRRHGAAAGADRGDRPRAGRARLPAAGRGVMSPHAHFVRCPEGALGTFGTAGRHCDDAARDHRR